MPTAVVDSSVLIAARVSSDQRHQTGHAIATGIDTGDLPVGVSPDDVVSEVLNYLQSKAGHGTAIETLDALLASAAFDIERTTESDFDAGRSLFRQYEGLSFTDSVIVAYMHRTDIEYLYSFDDDFDAVADVTRLETTENPFA
jgi:predicted nucleic acid-binding protein